MDAQDERDPRRLKHVREIAREYAELKEYLHQNGVSRSNVRLLVYEDYVNSMAEARWNDDQLTGIRLWREVYEAMWVIDSLRRNGVVVPRDLLVKAFDGHPVDEYKTEPGRNFFLQLRAAIYFLRAGYRVSLDEECDVVAQRGRDRLFIECKRIYSEEKAAPRAKDAIRQLERRLSGIDRSRRNIGIVWVDPSAAMLKRFFAYQAYSDLGVQQAIRVDLGYFARRYMQAEHVKHDPRIAAVVLQITAPMVTDRHEVPTRITTLLIPLGVRRLFVFRYFPSLSREWRLVNELFGFEFYEDTEAK